MSKTILITGSTDGIGLETARMLATLGHQVLLHGRNSGKLADAQHSLSSLSGGGRVEGYVADLSRLPDVEAFAQTIAEKHAKLDVLINNAGGAPYAEAATASPRFSEAIIRLNLIAPLNFSQLANQQMQQQPEGGCIVNIASVSTLRPSPGTAAYGAAKAGLVNLGSSLAVEWAPRVRVNAVVVGLTQTEQSTLHYGDDEGIAAVAATIPLGRMGLPADVGNACLFLASSLASYVSGTSFAVHGGGEKPAFLAAANAREKSQ